MTNIELDAEKLQRRLLKILRRQGSGILTAGDFRDFFPYGEPEMFFFCVRYGLELSKDTSGNYFLADIT